MNILNKIKQAVKKRIIKEKIVPIIIKDIESNLLQDKVALISGGSSGIGFAIAKKMIETGARVIIIGSKEEKCINASTKLGESCQYIATNLSYIKQMSKDIEQLISKQRIDILVNSAGIHGDESFGSISDEQWDTVMDINVKGLYFLSQIIAQHMIEKNIKGHILNISSASSIKPGWTPYEISKRAVNGITLGFAHKLAKHGIIVNGLAPGPTATPMLNFKNSEIDLSWSGNPSGRISTVEEIANLAIFMVSDLGNGIVGDTFFLTGGSGTVCIDK